MDLAIQEAIKGRYQTWQNPMVGAVIVKNRQILATGYHQHFGDSHAERDAISKLTFEQLSNSTLYVTLEPCSHYGKQPPCADLIIKSQIKRVVIAQVDPHSLVTGKGIQKLKDAGIEVVTGIRTNAAQALNYFYTFFYQHHRPWITLKQAISLDHKLGLLNQRTAITNSKVYEKVHQERSDYQAIIIGSNTAMIDNPSLHSSQVSDYPPIRVVLDRRGRLFKRPDLKLFTDQSQATWIFTQHPELFSSLHNSWVKIFQTDGTIEDVVNQLTKVGIQSLYVEGGAKIHQAFWQTGLVDELITYQAPVLLGKDGYDAFTPDNTVLFTDLKLKQLADNFRIEGKLSHV